MSSSLFSKNDEEENDEVELSPLEALEQLEVAWRNELLAPELLSSRGDLVDSVLDQIREMDESAKKAEKGSLDLPLKKMEVDRIRFVVTSYLRCRLQKIEKYVFHVVSDDEKRKRDGFEVKMSPEESRFASEYRTHLEEYFQAVALQKMPANAQKLDREKIVSRPNSDHYVFVRMRRKVPDVMIPNVADATREMEVDLEDDSQHIMPYKIAAPLVQNGSAYLL